MSRTFSNFNPKQLGSMAYWATSDFGLSHDTTSNRDSITSITERSQPGTGRALTNATKSQQPTYDTINTLNGYPALTWDGTQRLFVSPSSIVQNVSGVTMFAVARRSVSDTSSNNAFVWMAPTNSGVSTSNERVCLAWEGTTDFVLAGGRKSDTDSFQTANSLTAMSRGTANILSATIDFASSKIRTFLNGNPDCAQDPTTRALGYSDPVSQGSVFGLNFQEANAATASDNTSGNGISLGGRSGGTLFFNGQIWEVILYTRVLTDVERQQVEKYLADKYALPSWYSYTTWITYDGSSSTFGAFLLGKEKRPAVVHSLLGSPSWVGYQNDGVSGSVLSTQISDAAAANGINNRPLPPNLKAGKRLLVVELGANDIAALGHSAAQTFSDMVTYITAAKAAGFDHIFLILPHVRNDSTITANIQAFWAYVKANIATLYAAGLNPTDGFIDTTNITHLNADGDYNNLTYYQADKVHLTALGESMKSAVLAPVLANYI